MDPESAQRQQRDASTSLAELPTRHDLLLGSIPALYLLLVLGSVLFEVSFVLALVVASLGAIAAIGYALFLRPPR